jgi:hypothetical protein
MKAWIAMRLMPVPGTGKVAGNDAPIGSGMQSANLGAYRAMSKASLKAWADTTPRPRSLEFPAVMPPRPSRPSKS